jgi:hypothetical protein
LLIRQARAEVSKMLARLILKEIYKFIFIFRSSHKTIAVMSCLPHLNQNESQDSIAQRRCRLSATFDAILLLNPPTAI